MKFSLRQIAIFAAIARCGSVSQAAERLAMSQSAASNALLELERTYERPLFDRIGKSLHLNSDGRGLLPFAERLLGQAADIDSLLAGDRPGPLAVGATLTIGNYLATLLVADYLRQNPDSPATLHVANTHQIVASLLAFDCDLGLIEGEVSHPDLHCQPWLEDELLVFLRPRPPTRRHRPRRQRDAGGAGLDPARTRLGHPRPVRTPGRPPIATGANPARTGTHRSDQARRRIRPRHRLPVAAGPTRSPAPGQPGRNCHPAIRPPPPLLPRLPPAAARKSGDAALPGALRGLYRRCTGYRGIGVAVYSLSFGGFTVDVGK